MLLLQLPIVAFELGKIAVSSLTVAAIRYEGLQHHISYQLIHNSLAVNVVSGAAAVLLPALGLVLPPLAPLTVFAKWKSLLLFRLIVAILYHDIVWAFLAWIKYVKVVRQEVWAAADLDAWRRRAVAHSWSGMVVCALLLLVTRVSISLSYGTFDILTHPGVRHEALIFLTSVGASLLFTPWAFTLPPYLLMLCHARKKVSQVNVQQPQEEEEDDEIFGIYNPHAHPNPAGAWAVPVNGPAANYREEDDSARVLRMSVASLVLFAVSGVFKIVFPVFCAYGLLVDPDFPEERHVVASVVIKATEDVLDLIYVVHNCKKLLMKMVKSRL